MSVVEAKLRKTINPKNYELVPETLQHVLLECSVIRVEKERQLLKKALQDMTLTEAIAANDKEINKNILWLLRKLRKMQIWI